MTDITTSAATQRRHKPRLSWWEHLMKYSDWGIFAWSMLMYVFFYLPIVVLVVFSFNKQKLNVQWTGFTLHWYNVLFHDTDIIEFLQPWYYYLVTLTVSIVLAVVCTKIISKQAAALWLKIVSAVVLVAASLVIFYVLTTQITGAFATSIRLAVVSTVFAVTIGTLGAFALARFEFRTKVVWDGLNYTKIIIAEIVAGVSTLLFFVQLNNFLVDYLGFNFWGIFELGFSTVLIAHVAWNIPFVVVIIRARIAGFDHALEEAGEDLGSTPLGVFFRVTLPVIAPGILAAALLAFTLSFDDFVTTFFTTGQETTTLPLIIWSMVRMGITPEINAISTFMMAFSMIIIVVLELKAHISEDIA